MKTKIKSIKVKNEDKTNYFIEKHIDPKTGEVKIKNPQRYIDPRTGDIQEF